MIDELFKTEETFLKTDVHNKEQIDEETSTAILYAFLENKKKLTESKIEKTLTEINKLAEKIQELNKEIKKLGVSQAGSYKQIQESTKTIIWTTEFIQNSIEDYK